MNKEQWKKLEIKTAEFVAVMALIAITVYLVWKNVAHHY